MEAILDPRSTADYRLFLQIKSLPVFRIRGREAWFPDEYADRLGLAPPIVKATNYTPQAGLTVPCVNVPLPTMRQVVRELRGMGYSCHRIRGRDMDHGDNDTSVLIERTDGRPFNGQR